jgi:hypothetical protein
VSIFLSHSWEDRDLVAAFVDLLRAGIGLPPDRIFCSSVHGSLDPGVDFNDAIRRRLNSSMMLIPILSEAFNESRFCMYELGAAWAQSKTIIPVLVPPLTYLQMGAILQSAQAVQIDNPSGLSSLRDVIISRLSLRSTCSADWERHRNMFLASLQGIIYRNECWVYVLYGVREGRRQNVVGRFCLERVHGIPGAHKASGTAYWIGEDGSLDLRGTWHSDPALRQDDQLTLHYYMASRPEGDPYEKPDQHEGIIRLKTVMERPLRGDKALAGYVHDLFDWRNNSPSMYAERVGWNWDATIELVETKGRELFQTFVPRCGVRKETGPA